MDKLIKLLHEGNYSCVIKNKEISTFTQRGITDLYDLLNTDPAFLRGAQIADKVIGKAAAVLMVEYRKFIQILSVNLHWFYCGVRI